jgi:biopolymer transport protein ExbD
VIIRESDIENIHIDFVPMVDVLFNLLIFFLLATTIAQVEREMNIALPFAKSAGPITAALRELVINVDAQGQVILSGRKVSLDDLKQVVQQAVETNPEQKVVVRADRHVPYGTVVGVLDICKGAGIQEPYLDTLIE